MLQTVVNKISLAILLLLVYAAGLASAQNLDGAKTAFKVKPT